MVLRGRDMVVPDLRVRNVGYYCPILQLRVGNFLTQQLLAKCFLLHVGVFCEELLFHSFCLLFIILSIILAMGMGMDYSFAAYYIYNQRINKKVWPRS